jgi:DNA polymerase
VTERTEATDAGPWVPDPTSLSRLRTAAQECRGCELHAGATQAVMGDGPETARLMLVGEQPGDQEDRIGAPFVGPAGKLLDQALEAAGLDPDSVYRTNAVKHFRFTSRGKRRIHESPRPTHIHACGPWLAAELELVQPVGVVVLGVTGGRAVTGHPFRLKDHRGTFSEWPDDGPAVSHPPEWWTATTHPSAVLRSRQRDDDLAALVADLREVRRHLGG